VGVCTTDIDGGGFDEVFASGFGDNRNKIHSFRPTRGYQTFT